jgi:hypothetical protein
LEVVFILLEALSPSRRIFIGSHSLSPLWFVVSVLQMHNATVTYASSASTDVVVYEDLPGHHLLAVWNLIATTNDESYHNTASELPPATSHGYVEWDFSGVGDPMMFQRFLNVANY